MEAKTKYEERPWLKFYRKDVPADVDIPEQSVVETFDEAADKWKDKTALIFYGRKISYRELRDEKWRVDGFGIGERFMSLEYPAIKYGILRVLDVLSLFPYAVESKGFQSMLDFVHQKSSGGRYFAEPFDKPYAEFDFGQKKEPSRWVTFLINRIEKRVSEGK